MMKKIGLPFWKVGDNSFGSTLSYILFAERFGEVIPLMAKHEVREDLDLLILPGGADVDPARYGEMPNYFTGKPDLFKESFDRNYLQKYIDAGVPILGICRGMQSIAVHFGAKLIQHMDHETNDISKDPYSAKHDMLFLNDFITKENFTNKAFLPVNSRHHQVVDTDTLPEELVALAVHKSFNVTTGDGTLEMYAHNRLPIVGFQHHPEDMYEYKTVSFINSVVSYLIHNKTSIL